MIVFCLVAAPLAAQRTTVWFVPVVEMGRDEGVEYWTEIEVANPGDRPVRVDMEVRRSNGSLHPANVAGQEIAPGERGLFRFERVGEGPVEMGWARVVETHEGRRPQVRIRPTAYVLQGDELTKFNLNVRQESMMRSVFRQEWTNQGRGRRIYAINGTAEDAALDMCFGGKVSIRRGQTECSGDKRTVTIPAGATRRLHVLRPGPVQVVYRSSDGREPRLWLAILTSVAGTKSVFDVESNVEFDEERD